MRQVNRQDGGVTLSAMEEDDGKDGAAEARGTAEGAAASPGPVPKPVALADLPMAIATPGKAEVFGVAASAVGHLLVGLLIFGSLSSVLKPPEVIPVKLIPADQAPQKPPQHAPDKPPAAQPKKADAAQQKPPPAPPKAAAADTAKGASGGQEAPPPAKTDAAGTQQTPNWKDLMASLGLAEFGRKTTLPKALLAEVIAQAKRCWAIPDGWSDPRQVSVTLRFQLEPDGSLAGDPDVVEFPATNIGAAAAKAALTAVKQCGPYRLPADKYEQWRDIQLSLAP